MTKHLYRMLKKVFMQIRTPMYLDYGNQNFKNMKKNYYTRQLFILEMIKNKIKLDRID